MVFVRLQSVIPHLQRLLLTLKQSFGVTGNAGSVENTLYTVSTANGFPTFVMPLNTEGDGSIIASNGVTLFHFTANLFESMDLNALTTTEIPMSGPTFSEPFGAVFYNSANAF